MGCELIARLGAIAVLLAVVACRTTEPPREYPIEGQIYAVHPDRGEITIRHEDIPGLMPGMTMTFPVSAPGLLAGREPGDLVQGILAVGDDLGRLTSLTKTGSAPLPSDTNAAALAAGLLDVGDPVPDAAFIDQDDRRRSLSEWFGTPTLVTFIYTRCPLPSFCPLMDRNFATIQQTLAGDDRLAGRVRLISISFDPDYDTPATLAAHAATFKADPDVWTFLTGDRVTVDRVAARFGVGVVRPGDGSVDITHTLRTALIAADGTVARIYSGNGWSPDTVIADLRAAVR
jgi:protein SCO1/2